MREDGFHIFLKTEFQSLIKLIENDGGDRARVNCPPGDVVEYAARCPDNQRGRVCQTATFHVDVMSPVTAYYLETAFQGTEY